MAQKLELFYSYAEWTGIGKSDDSHGNYEAAKGICQRLVWDYEYVSCELRGFCKKAWVTDKDGNVLFELKREDKPRPYWAM